MTGKGQTIAGGEYKYETEEIFILRSYMDIEILNRTFEKCQDRMYFIIIFNALYSDRQEDTY